MRKKQKFTGLRKNEVVDILHREFFIYPHEVEFENLHLRPFTVFNPAFFKSKDYLLARVSCGYYRYASCIGLLDVKRKKGKIVIFPENRFNLMGVEDPRYSSGYIVCTGRSSYYFEREVNRVYPVVYDENFNFLSAIVIEEKNVRSVKNAFIFNNALFFRFSYINNPFNLCIKKNFRIVGKVTPLSIKKDCIFLELCEKFEEKVGWTFAPVKVDDDLYIAFLHALTRDERHYNLFFITLDEKLRVTGISECYVASPRTVEERYGDRPYVIFPCGGVKEGRKIYVSYGAADSCIGIGYFRIKDLFSLTKTL
jgi:predicted GH43/DUF377 family glycosyl hydrolase